MKYSGDMDYKSKTARDNEIFRAYERQKNPSLDANQFNLQASTNSFQRAKAEILRDNTQLMLEQEQKQTNNYAFGSNQNKYGHQGVGYTNNPALRASQAPNRLMQSNTTEQALSDQLRAQRI